MPRVLTKTVLIASGQSESEVIDMSLIDPRNATGLPSLGNSIVGIIMPAAFTGTSITFLGSSTRTGTYVPIYDSSTPGDYSLAVAASKIITPALSKMLAAPVLKIKSSANEAADRTLTLCVTILE